MATRMFELPELKLLADAVQSSKFITEKKSDELIAKIGTLLSRSNPHNLPDNIFHLPTGETTGKLYIFSYHVFWLAYRAGRRSNDNGSYVGKGRIWKTTEEADGQLVSRRP